MSDIAETLRIEDLAEGGLPENEARTLLDTTLDPRALDWLSVISAP